MNNNNNKELLEFQQYIIAEALSLKKDPEKYVKELGESGLKEAYKRFQAYKKKKTLKAEHGAKLQYFRILKNQCAEDEELVYFKKGGVVNCGCLKKEKGGQTPTKKDDVVSRFKAKKAQTGSALGRFADATGSQGGFKKAQTALDNKKKNPVKEGWDGKGNYIVSKKGIEERKKLYEANKTEDETEPPLINRGIGKNKCGNKIKKSACGIKVSGCGSKMRKKK